MPWPSLGQKSVSTYSIELVQDEEAFHFGWNSLDAQNEVLAGGGVAQDHNPRSPGVKAVELQALMKA